MVIAGGHAAFNPEPIADFIDAALLGDGEQAVGVITDIVRDAKRDGVGRDEHCWPGWRQPAASMCRASTT